LNHNVNTLVLYSGGCELKSFVDFKMAEKTINTSKLQILLTWKGKVPRLTGRKIPRTKYLWQMADGRAMVFFFKSVFLIRPENRLNIFFSELTKLIIIVNKNILLELCKDQALLISKKSYRKTPTLMCILKV
jgi:hypothetical protein